MWLVKVFLYFPTRVLANCIRERRIYHAIVHARKTEMRVSLSFFNETNTTLTNQLAVNHPQARNNLHTHAQS